MKRSFLSIAALAAALVAGACVNSPAGAGTSPVSHAFAESAAGSHEGQIIMHRPPALRIEVRTRRPSRRHVWIGGHWRYQHARYVWVKGRWAKRPRHGAVYVKSHWVRRGGGWVRVGGFWRF